MRYLRLFESFEFDDIDFTCKELGINQYTINPDGSVDVYGDLYICEKGLTKMPIKFGRVSGSFYCQDNKLTTLEGSPSKVGGNFFCFRNELTTLEGSPKEVGGNFYCSYNNLIGLEGAPSYVGGDFVCEYNKLTTLEGAPIEVGGHFWCNANKLISLEGLPKNLDINGFECERNPICDLYKLFPNHKSYMDSLDYNYLRGTNIVKRRLEEALDEVDIKMPKSIYGYRWI
jgi:hypothetical protein